ncbi:MAG: hypothetical protein U1A07_16910 [Phenylobacterium sp.]|nr:hypothetical protein [Phenylobacterium sp.]
MNDHRRAMAVAAKRAAKAAVEQYKARNPGAVLLDMKADVWVYGKKPRGYSKHRTEVVRMFLDSKLYLRQSNAQIAAQLSEKYSPYKIPGNVLTRVIPPKARSEIDAMLKAAGHNIDLTTVNTLSKIKGALLGRTVAKTGKTYETTITFADDGVVVGNRRFPMTPHENGYSRVRVGNNWIRCDVLEAMLKSGE